MHHFANNEARCDLVMPLQILFYTIQIFTSSALTLTQPKLIWN